MNTDVMNDYRFKSLKTTDVKLKVCYRGFFNEAVSI